MQQINSVMKEMHSKIKVVAKKYILVVFLILVAATLPAQEKDKDIYYANMDRKWLIEVPIWIPGLRGEFVFGDASLSNTNKSDEEDKKRVINDLNLQFFFVGRASVRFNKFWGHLDAFSSKINTDLIYDKVIGNKNPELVSLNMQLTVTRINAGYSIWKITNDPELKLEFLPYLGIRYYNTALSGSLLDSIYSGNASTQWIDPVVGLYVPFSYKRFLFNVQWDISFENSKISWMLVSQIQYRISKLVDVKIGWSQINMNYATSVKDVNLELNIKLTGPSAGIGFRF